MLSKYYLIWTKFVVCGKIFYWEFSSMSTFYCWVYHNLNFFTQKPSQYMSPFLGKITIILPWNISQYPWLPHLLLWHLRYLSTDKKGYYSQFNRSQEKYKIFWKNTIPIILLVIFQWKKLKSNLSIISYLHCFEYAQKIIPITPSCCNK